MMTKEQKQYRDNIKEAYKSVIDDIFNGIRIDPYFFNWIPYFSPIECEAWSVVRDLSIPMYPEYPACGYFIDFADPVKKIGVELDGKQYHNPKKDKARDLILSKSGWLIYRIPGREMFGSDIYQLSEQITELEDGWEEDYHRVEKLELITRWLEFSGEGVFHAIVSRHYERDIWPCSVVSDEVIDGTLHKHTYITHG